jgi:hypothetical protein
MFARPTTQGGGEVSLDWLAGWSNERGRQGVGQDLMRVQFQWPIGMP